MAAIEPAEGKSPSMAPAAEARPFVMYTRPQAVHLHRSPLVTLPKDMPDLKDWFGIENEQVSHRKDSEPTTPGRERRFRRDQEDSEPGRPPFRSSLSQVSQMGNFKHQSLRGERDDKDRERDGNDRLRNLSDKYDRDRLTLPLGGMRGKERDAAPHLSMSSTRQGGQAQSSTIASRRAEARENARKKAGESSEDWRSKGRDDRSDNAPSDRARSRPRDLSRSRREPSTSRRDRDDRDTRNRDKRSERDSDNHRDRRTRDNDDPEDDPRRWRDDGKRDERIAARKERERAKDREVRERDKDRDHDGRWTVVEERDSRSKRNAREKRSTAGTEDAKEKDDKKDKEKERTREKEKEPAWMDTYIPAKDTGGILGGKNPEGELDGIQAWKKGLKEKEEKNKTTTTAPGNPPAEEATLDTVFQMLVKREEEKKQDIEVIPASAGQSSLPPQEGSASLVSPVSKVSITPQTLDPGIISAKEMDAQARSSSSNTPDSHRSHPSQSLLSLLTSESTGLSAPTTSEDTSRSISESGVPSSRFFPKLLPREKALEPSQGDYPNPSIPSNQYEPPAGSRLLAFASRTQHAAASPAHRQSSPIQHGPNAYLDQSSGTAGGMSSVPPKMDPHRSSGSFAPFEEQGRVPLGYEERSNDGFNRPHRPTVSNGVGFAESNGNLDAGAATLKGSRFAKFFDGRPRENFKNQNEGLAFAASTPPPLSLQGGPGSLNGTSSAANDQRAMDEIFTMLNNSSQGQRNMSLSSHPSGMPNGQYNQLNTNVTPPIQQHSGPPPHQMNNSRLDAFNERLDDRFVPDGMVPGLRNAPPPRDRIYAEAMEDLHLNTQAALSHLRATNDNLITSMSSSVPLQGLGHPGRHQGLPLNQPQYRGGPPPTQHSLLQGQMQRLPPGLANLGGRPPHEPSHFVGASGLSHGNLPNLPLSSQIGQQHYGNANTLPNNFNPHLRGSGPSPLQNPGHHNTMQGLNSLDPRMVNPSHHLGLPSGGQGPHRALVSGGNGGFAHQQGPMSQQLPLQSMRHPPAQQSHPPPQLPPQMIQHQMQPPMQQQGLGGAGHHPTQDLMALLMSGHRE